MKKLSLIISIFTLVLVLAAPLSEAKICINFNQIKSAYTALTSSPQQTQRAPSPRIITPREVVQAPVLRVELPDNVKMQDEQELQASRDQAAYAKSRAGISQKAQIKRNAPPRKPVRQKSRSTTVSSPSRPSSAQTIASGLSGGSCTGICF